MHRSKCKINRELHKLWFYDIIYKWFIMCNCCITSFCDSHVTILFGELSQYRSRGTDMSTVQVFSLPMQLAPSFQHCSAACCSQERHPAGGCAVHPGFCGGGAGEGSCQAVSFPGTIRKFLKRSVGHLVRLWRLRAKKTPSYSCKKLAWAHHQKLHLVS